MNEPGMPAGGLRGLPTAGWRPSRSHARCRRSLAAGWALPLLAVVWVTSRATLARAQLSFEGPPVDYLKGAIDDPVSRLQKKIDRGEVELEHGDRGYLESVLAELGIPRSSQVLVFSKTSFQLRKISPQAPRAIYFGDDVYVGWVRGGELMEISSMDPGQGAIFYTIDQKRAARPTFVRRTHECLQCHSSSRTRGVPGNLVRSVLTAPDGRPVLRAGTHLTDHTSPLQERWGGWYVTGTHGAQRHLGNLLVDGLDEADDPENPDTDQGANLTDLGDRFRTSSYLTPHSDIVALMVLEHQTQMHNLITRAGFTARIAMNDDRIINEMLGRPADRRSDTTERRIRSAGDSLVRYMLFSGESALTDPIAGTSGFAAEFASRGPRDGRGRSLRDFDLKTRLFKYPLSYLVYSEAFDRLPSPVKEHVYRRLWAVLSGEDGSDDFRHLSAVDREAILEILLETKRDLPEYWRRKRQI